MDAYTGLYYHFIWATKQRAPCLTPWVETRLYGFLRERCESKRYRVYGLNGTADHVHLACSLPPTVCISDVIKDLKGSSAYFINHLPEMRLSRTEYLYWQIGYGVLTFSQAGLPKVVAYILNQKQHHADHDLQDRFERVGEPVSPGGAFPPP